MASHREIKMGAGLYVKYGIDCVVALLACAQGMERRASLSHAAVTSRRLSVAPKKMHV